MVIEKALEGKGESHYKVCRVLLSLFVIFFIGRIVLCMINTIYLGMQTASNIQVVDNGTGYRYDLLVGAAQCEYKYLPFGWSSGDVGIVSGKAFAMSVLALQMLTVDIPLLVVLNAIGKFLKVIGKTHSPFVSEAVVHTDKAGMVLLRIGFLSELVITLGIGVFAYHTLNTGDLLRIINVPYVFAGMVLLLFGDIYRRGCALQQEADETL